MSHLPSVAAARPPHAPGTHPDAFISYACRIAPNVLLCCGYLPHALSGKEQVHIDGLEAKKPYLAAILKERDTPLTAMILRIDEQFTLESAGEVAFTYPGGAYYWYNKTQVDETGREFPALLQALAPQDRAKLYYLLLKYAGIQSADVSQRAFLALCIACQRGLETEAAPYRRAFWLLPDTLYMEVRLTSQPGESLRAIFAGSNGIYPAQVNIAPVALADRITPDTAEPYVPILLQCASFADAETLHDGAVALLFQDRLVAVKKLPAYTGPHIASLLGYLRQLGETERLGLRDFINHHLIQHTPAGQQNEAAHLVRNLQLYLPPAHSTLYQVAQPFGLNLEAVYTIGREGVLLCGWMHDPGQMLRELVLFSDLGYSIRLEEQLTFFRRDDVMALYEDATFPPDSAARHGFIAYVEFPPAHRAHYVAWPEGFSYRLTAHLKGGLSYTVSPEPYQADPFTLRDALMAEKMATLIAQSLEAGDVLGQAVRAVQEMCEQRIEARAVYTVGTLPARPHVSVVIPLYRTLDYVQAQVAHFAGDPAMEGAEIIYVLDSPEQEETARTLIHTLHALYGVALTLVVLSHNGGYAIASNMGTRQARGEKLLLLNSDVLPFQNGWLETLCEFADAQEKPGAVAPLLLYEDGGIQHAGMYFALDEATGHYENLHYFKGYPATHPAAGESRAVPAVSAACLLVERAAFENAGRFTTGYAIGDFEDSDLCLKLAALGYTHYYCAETALYHFERQSFSSAPSASRLRYQVNAREHHARWRTVIKERMERHDGR